MENVTSITFLKFSWIYQIIINLNNLIIGYLLRNFELADEFKVDAKKYKNLISEKQFERLGWTDDGDDNTKMLRVIIIDLACSSGNKKCLDGAKAEYKKMKNGQKIKPNLVSLVRKYGAAQNEYENWQFLWQKYLETNLASEKLDNLRLLSMSKNETTIKRSVKLLMKSF